MPPELVNTLAKAKLPALIIGQYEAGDLRTEVDALNRNNQLLVLPELLSDVGGSERMNAFDTLCDPRFAPDIVLQIGGHFIHKRFKQWLRQTDCQVIRVGYESLPDTFCHLTCQIEAPAKQVLAQLADELPKQHIAVRNAAEALDAEAAAMRQKLLGQCLNEPVLTLQGAVAHLAEALRTRPQNYTLHLGNSSAVRAAQQVMLSGNVPVFCNRGVNGIEGSLSAAVGYALGMWGTAHCGHRRFEFLFTMPMPFGTSNSPAGLRILLLNNGHGAIFDHLPGLADSPARDAYIAAGGRVYSAKGVAQTFGIDYQAAHTSSELNDALQGWWNEDAETAQLIEVFLAD